MSIQFINAIVCDDVRREDNGKVLIIGVYPNDILVSEFPRTIHLNIWTQFQTDKTEDIIVEFQAIDQEKKIYYESKAAIKRSPQTPMVTVTIPRITLNLVDETMISFQLREEKKRWKTIKSMPIRLKPTT